jgi:hypothetical protein
MYQTIKATVRGGKIELLEDIILPENAPLLVTILDVDTADKLTLGNHLIYGLQDIVSGNVVEVQDEMELPHYLNALFQNKV